MPWSRRTCGRSSTALASSASHQGSDTAWRTRVASLQLVYALRRQTVAGACAVAALLLAGCGGSGSRTDPRSERATRRARPRRAPRSRPPAAPTIASAAAGSAAKSARPASPRRSPTPWKPTAIPRPRRCTTRPPPRPSKAGAAIVAAGAPSNAEVRKELQQMQAVERSAKQTPAAHAHPRPGGESIGGNGTIPIPTNVPEVIQKVIAGANEIADFPYVYGGGHASFIDNAYDCSGRSATRSQPAACSARPRPPANSRAGGRRAPASTSPCTPTPGTPTCTSTGSSTTPPGAAACTRRAGRSAAPTTKATSCGTGRGCSSGPRRGRAARQPAPAWQPGALQPVSVTALTTVLVAGLLDAAL